MLTVTVMNDLKIFDRRLSDSTVKIQHVRLTVIVPCRSFIVQLYHIIHSFSTPTFWNYNKMIKIKPI